MPQALDSALPAVAESLEGVKEALEGKVAARRRRERETETERERGNAGSSLSPDDGEAAVEVLDGLSLWRDSCFSLAALAASHRGAAGAMLEAGCGGGLVAALAGAHDELLPAVEAAFYSPSTATEKVSFFVWKSKTAHHRTRLSEPPGPVFFSQGKGDKWP